MLHSHLHQLESLIHNLSIEAGNALESISFTKNFKRGDILLQQGQVCRQSYFIVKGVARKYYLNNGKEITTELYFDNDLAVSLHSYAGRQPSQEIIEILADTEASVTDYESFQNAKTLFPELITLDLSLTEYYALWLEQRLFDFHTLSAGERYEKLLLEHPHAVQKVQLTHIASYLGISLETLSRVRARK